MDILKTVVIILAGGSGKRFGSKKQFVPICGKPVLAHTVGRFKGFTKVITIAKNSMLEALTIASENDFSDCTLARGGETRQESVFSALKHIHKVYSPDNVVITDANRPLITNVNIHRGLKLLKVSNCDGVVSVCKAVNTICTFNEDQDRYVVLPRKDMYDLLMPQFFKFNIIYEAHKNTKLVDITDDSQLLDQEKIALLDIPFWEGLKLTYPEDYKIFEILLKKEKK